LPVPPTWRPAAQAYPPGKTAIRELARIDFRPNLPSIAVPTFELYGSRDPPNRPLPEDSPQASRTLS
jgi:hypothetical protein